MSDDDYEGDIVTVAHRFNALEAQLLRGRLRADGIPATLGDAHTVQTDTLLTAALGGVRVMVPASYAERARRTIAALEGGAFMLGDDDDVSGDALAEPPARRTGLPVRHVLAASIGLLVLGVLAAFAS